MQTLDEAYVKRFTRKLYRFFEQDNYIIEFRKMRHYTGWITGIEDLPHIEVCPKQDLLSTFIHEVVHYLHPDWSEPKVLRAEKYLMNHLTTRQLRNIFKKLAEAL